MSGGVGIVMGYRQDGLASISSGVKFFSTAFRLAVGSTQPIKWVPGALFLGVEQPGHEADNSFLVPSSRMLELYLHFSICLRGIVLNEAQGHLYRTLSLCSCMGEISAYIILVGKLEGKWHMEAIVIHGVMILK
jgi:hypothetical protein